MKTAQVLTHFSEMYARFSPVLLDYNSSDTAFGA